MAFITRCWRNARPDPLVWLAFVFCVVCWPLVGHAQSPAAQVSQLRLERTGDGVYLSASVNFVLAPAVEDALLKGIPMFFVAQADVLRERWYWTNKNIITTERHMRLAYQPLTQRWRLNVASGAITNNSLGVAINQTFDSLPEALATVARLPRWKIADTDDLDPDARYTVDFSFRLDVSQLPRPFQIGALGQSEWTVIAAASQRLPAESTK